MGAEPAAEHLHAILDGARDEATYEAVTGGDDEWRCLYAGELPDEVRKVAPYLVRFAGASSPLLDRLLGAGRGRSLGILLRSRASIDDLRKHLRRFLIARAPSGKTLVFRYYDPRVLRVYLPTCNEAELRFVFGAGPVVSSFIVEQPDDAAPCAYRLERGRLVVEDLQVPLENALAGATAEG